MLDMMASGWNITHLDNTPLILPNLTPEEQEMYPYMSSLEKYVAYTSPLVTAPVTDTQPLIRITSKDGSIVELFSCTNLKVVITDNGVVITEK